MRRGPDRITPLFKSLQEYCPSEVKLIKDEDGENAVIYGKKCYKIDKGLSYEGYIFLSDYASDYIGFANIHDDNIEKLSIKNIKEITFKNNTENLKGYKPQFPNEIYFQLSIGQKFYDFCVPEKKDMLLIVKGLLSIFKSKDIKFDNSIDSFLMQMVNKYDENYDKVFDYKEFQAFSKSLGIDPKILMLDIDANHDGVITQEEVLNYLSSKTTGQQLLDVFNKFSSVKKKGGPKTMSPSELQKFFHRIQMEYISDLESYQLVVNFLLNIDKIIKRKINKKIQNSYIRNNFKIIEEDINEKLEKLKKKQIIDFNLELTLRDFNNMLNSSLLTVYKTEKIREPLDLDRPLTDYFIKSTHNTYLTGNQLTSFSSIKMYSTSVLDGYRLVELDCYNGEGDDIVITHGYTLASKLHLVDILHELKESAFINSDLPVILSIENHLDKKHQEIMAQNFKDILVDLYIFPFDQKPDHIPTLNELRNKFIIKCSGKRLWENDEIPKEEKMPKNTVKREKSSYKLKKYILFDRFLDVTDSDEEEELKKDKAKKEEEMKKAKEEEEPESNLNLLQIKTNAQKEPSLKEQFQLFRRLVSDSQDKIQKKEDEEKLENESEIYSTLENVRGFLGTKFKYEKIETFNYKSWEFITLKCSKLLKLFSDPKSRIEMIKLTQHCMLKAYPESFTSSNYDIIKCWACGCQVAAVNIQALENDYTLFNTVFFYQNHKCGYVLKPLKLIDKNYMVLDDYQQPKYKLRFKIYTIYNLLNLVELSESAIKEKGTLSLEVYTLGSEADECFAHRTFQLYGGLIFPIIRENDKFIEIPVYEDDLGGVMMKIYYNGKMIGRGCIPYCMMKNGVRRIPIYDNDCWICEGTFVLAFFDKMKYL